MFNQYVELLESTLAEGRDGVEGVDKGHLAYAKKKLASGGVKALEKYIEFLKKNELTRLSDGGKENYGKRLKFLLSIKESEDEDDELEDEEVVEAEECDDDSEDLDDDESDDDESEDEEDD